MRGDHCDVVRVYEIGEQFVDKPIRNSLVVFLGGIVVLDGIEVAWPTSEVSVSFNENFLVSSEMGLTVPERCDTARLHSTFEIECRFRTVVLLRFRLI